MSDEQNKPNRLKAVLRWILKSPVTVVLLLAFAYFGFQAYVAGNQPLLNKAGMIAVAAIWILWFLLRHMFMLLLILLAAGGAYYIYYTNLPQTKCEKSGGVWNEKTKICEEKTGFWAQIQKLWNEYKK